MYEVKSIQIDPNLAEVAVNMTSEESEKRLHMKQYQNYRETNKARYALKHIKEDYFTNHDSDSFIQATRYMICCLMSFCSHEDFQCTDLIQNFAIMCKFSDLALEAELLASLQHPNIIKLRGITYSGPEGLLNGPRYVRPLGLCWPQYP